MGKKIIFYGGCQGVNKSALLKDAIEIIKKQNSTIHMEAISISALFEEKIKNNKEDNSTNKVLWYEDDWKKHDDDVIRELCDKIKTEDQINIINSHFSVPYKGKENYVPGIEISSLKKLLEASFFDLSSDDDDKRITDIKNPCFGLLLIDPEPSLILKYYKDLFNKGDIIKNGTVLNYLSEQSIAKDLEQNRRWAYTYYDTAREILGNESVLHKTIYITKENKANNLNNIKNDIASFLNEFCKTI